MSRWQLVWWYWPHLWRWGPLGPYPASGLIYSGRWQCGPLEIRRWETGS